METPPAVTPAATAKHASLLIDGSLVAFAPKELFHCPEGSPALAGHGFSIKAPKQRVSKLRIDKLIPVSIYSVVAL